MGYTVEQQCPQCGAPIELEETDHLIRCPYCHVKNYLFASDCFRFVLPLKTSGKDIIYTPYIRFKGSEYLCKGLSINHRIVDITRLGVSIKPLPLSLGVRPQALKMKFVTPDMGGSFLISSLQICDAPGKVEQQDSIVSENPLFHHAYIGEVLSVIYLPLYIQGDRLFDGVVDQPIAKISDAMSSFTSLIDNNPRWYITFMGTVCPQCGWNLDGARDSVVLTCNNCETAWEASKGKFIQVNFATVPGKKDDVFYLPFWKMNVRFKDPEINSYADFIRITNQPKAVQTQWEHQDICFWTPAFKIRPKIFLQLSKNLTINQMTFALNNNIPQKNLFPVTLPQREAAQSIKVILASLAMNKKAVFSFLPQTHCIVRETTLVFLPFNDTRHEMHQEHLPVSIHKKTLEYGRYL